MNEDSTISSDAHSNRFFAMALIRAVNNGTDGTGHPSTSKNPLRSSARAIRCAMCRAKSPGTSARGKAFKRERRNSGSGSRDLLPGKVPALVRDHHRSREFITSSAWRKVKRHAITCTTLNEIVQSLLYEVSDYRHGAFRCIGDCRQFELNEVRRQRRNDVAESGLARIPDRVS